jgi:uridine kinase
VSHPVVIAVCGGSGSGKTTVASKLVGRVGEDSLAVVSHDSYYRNLAELPRTERDRVNFDHPDALETSRLVADLAALKSGNPIEIPNYDFTTHSRRRETRRVEPRRVVLVADRALRELFDVRIFVDTDPDVRLIRRLRRDVAERGRSVESVLEQYEATVRPMHLEFVEPSKHWADLIIPGGGLNGVAIDFLLSRIEALAAPR